MAMIDILKLNAELDAMISRQDAEVTMLNHAVLAEREDRYAQMLADIEEMYEVMKELKGEVKVKTDIKSKYGYPADPYYIRINGTYGREYGVYSGKDCWLGPVLFRHSYGEIKRKNAQDSWRATLTFDIDKIVDEWAGQRDVFRHRFEEECVKLIKAKAEKANARYMDAKRKHEEVCGECVIEDRVQ